MNRPHFDSESPAWLPSWAFVNAVALASSSIYALLKSEYVATVLAAAASFGFLFLTAWRRLGAGRLLHAANLITLLRLAAVLLLSSFGGSADYPVIIGAGVALLLADCLDGWAAGHFGRQSEFGEFFDKETDALWLLVVCLLAVRKEVLPPWIVLLGLLRYLFVLVVFVFRSSSAKEERSGRGRRIYTTVMLILLAAFLPFPVIRLPLSFMAAFLLGASFLIDSFRIFGPSSQAGSAPSRPAARFKRAHAGN